MRLYPGPDLIPFWNSDIQIINQSLLGLSMCHLEVFFSVLHFQVTVMSIYLFSLCSSKVDLHFGVGCPNVRQLNMENRYGERERLRERVSNKALIIMYVTLVQWSITSCKRLLRFRIFEQGDTRN